MMGIRFQQFQDFGVLSQYVRVSFNELCRSTGILFGKYKLPIYAAVLPSFLIR